MAFLAYYYHWSEKEILSLPHGDRRRWCDEISAIHRANGDGAPKEKSILEWKLGQ